MITKNHIIESFQPNFDNIANLIKLLQENSVFSFTVPLFICSVKTEGVKSVPTYLESKNDSSMIDGF